MKSSPRKKDFKKSNKPKYKSDAPFVPTLGALVSKITISESTHGDLLVRLFENPPETDNVVYKKTE